MGMYVNPAVTQEATEAVMAISPEEAAKTYWLQKHAARVTPTEVLASVSNYDRNKKSGIILCHVNNVLFSSIAVAYSKQELTYFLNMSDTRIKDWYLADPADVANVLPVRDAQALRRMCNLEA